MKNLRKRLSIFLTFALVMQMLTPLTNAQNVPIDTISSTQSDIVSQQSNADEEQKSISQLNDMSSGQEFKARGIVLTDQGIFDEDENDKSFYIADENTSDVILANINKEFDIEVGSNIEFKGRLNYSKENGLQIEDITTMNILRVNRTVFDSEIKEEKKISELSDSDNKKVLNIKDAVVKKIGKPNKNSKQMKIIVYDSKEEDKEVTVLITKKDTGLSIEEIKKQINEKINLGSTLKIKGIYVQVKNGDKLIYVKSIDDINVVEEHEKDNILFTISQIQGENHTSQYVDSKTPVQLEDAVVTYIKGKDNFFIQSLKEDENPNTSEAIEIYSKKHGLEVGDKVSIKGWVKEYVYKDAKNTDLTTTQISTSEKYIKKLGKSELPKPIIIGKDRIIPTKHIDDDHFAKFEQDDDMLDFWESLEGMLVKVEQPKIIAPQNYSELYVVPKDFDGLNALGGLTINPEHSTNLNAICLYVNDDNGYSVKNLKAKQGDELEGDVEGVVGYGFTKYRILTKHSQLPEIREKDLKSEVTKLEPSSDKLSIASYNIENFSANSEDVEYIDNKGKNKINKGTKDEKVKRIAKSFVQDLKNPDIITVIEMQDNSGFKDDETIDASQSAKRLSDEIKALGGVEYEYVDISPENNKDGGAPGGNIRLGFFYNPKRVSLKENKDGVGDANTSGIYTKDKGFNFNPVRVNPTSPAFSSTRKSLAGEFVFNGHDVIIVINHLSSKRGDDGLFGKIQPPNFKSEDRKMQQVTILRSFVEQIQNENPDANIVLTGDFNDFEFSKPLKYMTEGGNFVNLLENYDESRRFAYSYNGINQSLDHILVSKNLKDKSEFDIVHVNSPFMEEHGRASDHDPLMVHLNLPKKEEKVETIKLKAEVKWLNVKDAKTQKMTIQLQKDGQVEKEQEVVGDNFVEFEIKETEKDKYKLLHKELKDFDTKLDTNEEKTEYTFTNTKKEELNSDESSSDSSSGGGSSSRDDHSNSVPDKKINRVSVSQNKENTNTNTIEDKTPKVNKSNILSFDDIKSHWAGKSIENSLKKGYFVGTSKFKFSPNDGITRGQFITVLGRMSSITLEDLKSTFIDVEPEKYYTKYINWAVKNSIIKGYNNNTFRPNNLITREEISVVLAKYLKNIDKKSSKDIVFKDNDKISPWALDSVKFVVQLGILQGRTDGTFGAKDFLTRAEMAQVITNIEKLLEK